MTDMRKIEPQVGMLARREFVHLASAFSLILAVTPAGVKTAEAETLEPIERLTDALLSAMKAGERTDFPRRFSALAPAVDGALDFGAVLRASMGPRWATLLPKDQTRLVATFRRYTISSYVANFDHWTGQSFRISPHTRRLNDGRAVVQTFIVPTSGVATELSYVMRRTAAGWREVDMLAAGSISRVAVQRSDFTRLLSDGGVPGLLAGLERKMLNLSGRAPPS